MISSGARAAIGVQRTRARRSSLRSMGARERQQGDRGRGTGQAVQEGPAGGGRDRPARGPGRDLRLPGPQRRRQVDHGADADHAAATHRWLGTGGRLRGGHRWRPGARAHRRRAAGGRAGPVPERPRAHAPADRAARPAARRAQAPRRRADRAGGPVRGGRSQGQRLLGRHAPPAGPCAGAGARPPDPVPGRAHHGPGPPEPHGVVGGGRAPVVRRRRDGVPDHPVPGGGRPAGRPRGDHRRRQDRGRGHAGGAQGRDRRAVGRGHTRRPAPVRRT